MKVAKKRIKESEGLGEGQEINTESGVVGEGGGGESLINGAQAGPEA